MDFEALQQLIAHAKTYEEQTGNTLTSDKLHDFSKWLAIQTQDSVIPSLEPTGETLDSLIGKFIGFMYRFAKFYTKKALENSVLVTLDDFTYLGSIFLKAGSSKTEIIDYHIHEKTTGIEILKRLKKNKLIEERPSLHDRRSKALFITEKGKDVFFMHIERMQQVGTIITGNLEEYEKQQLVLLLAKLNDFHQTLYQEHRKGELADFLTFVEQ